MIIQHTWKYFRHVCLTDFILSSKKTFSTQTKPPWNIMFFGTDSFSVSSLKALHKELKNGKLVSRLEVVTSTKAKSNPVSNYAMKENLIIHSWPFTQLSHNFDIGVVVSFGHLIPNEVINSFHLGILNVHASLLPRWRGAAPIIYTIMNEDKETGVTVMRIQPKHFDIGEIVLQSKINIPENIILPDLHHQLAELGSAAITKCLQELPSCLSAASPQPTTGITYAPKVSPANTRVNWREMSGRKIYALARAFHDLLPLTTTWQNTTIKLYDLSLPDSFDNNHPPGTIQYNKQTQRLMILCADGSWIHCARISMPSKKIMSAADFNNGFVTKVPEGSRIFQ